MALADIQGFPVAMHLDSAAPHEVTLVQDTLEQSLLCERPQRLIGDKRKIISALFISALFISVASKTP